MKKLLNRSKKPTSTLQGARITNETVAQHRERILAGGRKFKYPIQYARHRLVLNTIIIILIAFAGLSILTYVQLYHVQNSGPLFYRLSRIVPVPVANVDGQAVRYSDYLMYYRSSEHYLMKFDNLKPDSEDGKRQLNYVKRETMDKVILDAYAARIGKDNNIGVDEDEIDRVVERDRNTRDGKISQEAYDTSAMRVLNWEPSEYRHDVARSLLTNKVAYLIDEKATEKQKKATALTKDSGADFKQIAAQLSDDTSKVTSGSTGLIKIDSSFGGVTQEAAKLEKGTVSGAIKSNIGDGYYFVKVVEKTGTHVNFEFLQIPITELKSQLEQLKKDNKITEYIAIAEVKSDNDKRE